LKTLMSVRSRRTSVASWYRSLRRAEGVDATFMLFQRHGWDIHALSAEPGQASGTFHESRKHTKEQQHQDQGRALGVRSRIEPAYPIPFMIADRNGRYTAGTVHDHENRLR